MTQAIGHPDLDAVRRAGARLQQDKKKGCKKQKCSNWKGGKCRCGRE
jgi:hypothetical protein